GVAPRSKRRDFGKRIALGEAMPRPQPVGLQVVPPPVAQIGAQVVERILRMDIAIHDVQSGFRAGLPRVHRLPNLDVNGRLLTGDCSRPKQSRSRRPTQAYLYTSLRWPTPRTSTTCRASCSLQTMRKSRTRYRHSPNMSCRKALPK